MLKNPYLKSYYMESHVEEDIDMKNQNRITSLPDPISIREACSKNYVDTLFNDPSTLKNSAHIDLNDRNFTNARFIQVNQLPQIDSHLTAKLYVDNTVDESSLLRLDPDEILDLDNQDYIILNSTLTTPKTVIEIPTKAYIDNLHEENERSRRDLGIDFYDESNDLVKDIQENDFNDNKLINIDSITVNREPNSDNELPNKKYIDDELHKNTIITLNQTLQNYFKISVDNDTYHLTRNNKIQLTDTTIIKAGNNGITVLAYWRIVCNDKDNSGKISNFIKSTKTKSPTNDSGATSLPPVGNAFMYIETSSNNHGNNVYVILERIDIIQTSNITFYYNRYSISDPDFRAMGRFRIQILLEGNIWSSRYSIPKNDRYCDTPTDWTLVSLNTTEENYGVILYYDQINSAHADMCFSNITTPHSVY